MALTCGFLHGKGDLTWVIHWFDGTNARLWLDQASGLPRRRQLTVRFGTAEMKVLERYTRFEVE